MTKISPTKPQSAGDPSDMWNDPDDGSHGVLLSDRIRFYAEHVNLIDPFTDVNLGPASYDLTLGSDCWYAGHLKETGEGKRTLAHGERLVLPPNSITFVTSRENLNMPFYLAARFNLKLRLLHEGLLLGTGPQIDPGFSGRLSCPLHNISSEKISLAAGESFAVVEFHKTSPFAQREKLTANDTITDVRRRGESKTLKGLGDYPCITFPSRSLNREPVKRYVPPGRLVSSSVEGIATEQHELEESVNRNLDDFGRRMGRVNTLAYISVVAVGLSVAAVGLSIAMYFFAVVNWNKSVNETAIRAEEQVKTLDAKQRDLEGKIKTLDDRLSQIPASAKAQQSR